MSRGSRPTTPLRRIEKGSFGQLSSGRTGRTSISGPEDIEHPVDVFEPVFAELVDNMTDLVENFNLLGMVSSSLTDFNESFASFLYGLNMNAFCRDFSEAPSADALKRAYDMIKEEEELSARHAAAAAAAAAEEANATFMTNETSFDEVPPARQSDTNTRGSSSGTRGVRRGVVRGAGTARGTQRPRTAGSTATSRGAHASTRGASSTLRRGARGTASTTLRRGTSTGIR